MTLQHRDSVMAKALQEHKAWEQEQKKAVFAGIFIAIALVALPFTILLLLAMFKF